MTPDSRRRATLLPDPPAREAEFTIISVDDHLIESPDLFEGRIPGGLADRAPRVEETDDGSQFWVYEDARYPNIGLNAVVGRPREEWSMEPARFDEMRPGCWNADARIADMDLAGIWASLNFPSLLPGFAGVVFARGRDRDLGLACVRAWNDWHHDVWAQPYPERIIALQLPWLADPGVAADEVRKNAARGFKAVTFVENPANLAMPSMHTKHWDPFLAACEETDTVVCLHTGSSAWSAATAREAPLELLTTLFPANALAATADWIWAGIPLRFPNLKVALSEGGLGWVPMLLDRLEYVVDHSASGMGGRWHHAALRPAEALQRNFWFCTIDDPSTLELRHRIGIDHIMVEVDYPHADSTWPDTQRLIRDRMSGFSKSDIEAITWRNAARLFRHPGPSGEVPGA